MFIFLFQFLHRGSNLLHHQRGWKLRRSAWIILCPKLTTTTEVAEYFVAPNYYIAASSYYVELKYYTLRLQSTTPQPTLHLTTKPKSLSTSSKVEYHIATYGAPDYYLEEPKYSKASTSAPEYNILEYQNYLCLVD